MKTYIINGIVALLLIIGVGLVVPKTQPVPQQSDVLGGLSERDIQAVSLKVASNGTKITKFITGSCTSFTANTVGNGDGITQAASTTKNYDCAVTGVVSGDKVFAQFATSTPGTVNGWSIVGAKASTTSGYITLLISNLTGASRVPSGSGVGSSTSYWIVKS